MKEFTNVAGSVTSFAGSVNFFCPSWISCPGAWFERFSDILWLINCNRSAAKISKVMSSIKYPLDVKTLSSFLTLFVGSNMDYISFFQLWIVFVWGISVRRTKVSGNVVEDLPFTVIVASYFHSLAIVKNFHPCEQNQIANRSMITHGQLWYNHS